MRTRAALAVGLLTVGLVATSSQAGPSLCFQVADDKGDVNAGHSAVPLQSDNLDVISADLGSDAKNITAVIRVTKLANPDSTAPTGVAYNFRFTAPGVETPLYFLASIEPEETFGTSFEFGSVNGNQLTAAGDAKGVIDEAKNEIRITAPLAFGGLAKLTPGTKLTGMQAITQRREIVLLLSADTTVVNEKTSYTTGSDTCVLHA